VFLLSPQTKVFLARQVTDMRKSFRGLLVLTEAVLRQDPVSGHLFVFVNRRRDLLKILHWDGSGYWIWYRYQETDYL
jgi:transposase